MMGEGPLYRERHWGRIKRKECGEEMDIRFLLGHIQTQHGREAEGRLYWEATAPGEETRTYSMAFLTAGGDAEQSC